MEEDNQDLSQAAAEAEGEDNALPKPEETGVDNDEPAETAEEDATEAASGTTSTGLSAAAPSSTIESAGSSAILSGSRQTSLAHWLL